MNPMKWIDGYKTQIAGWLCIVTGLAQMFGVTPVELNTSVVSGWELVMFGFGLVGISGKFDKLMNKKK